MKQLSIFHAFFILIISLFFCAASDAGKPVDTTTLAPMLKKVLPAVVNVKAQVRITDFETLREIQKQRKLQPEMDNEERIPPTGVSVGSGVIIDANKGYVLTNAHVVNDAQSVTVTLADGRHFKANIIGADKPSDVALLEVKAKNLTQIPIGDTSQLQVGDFVVAIGSPFGVLNQTVTSGIVSALGRNTLGIESFENFIQTDASINPGNSGGALVNMQGELIGINTAILSPDRGSIGIGFAIPINMAKSVVDQLIEYGNVKRGILGIGLQDITPELSSAFNTKVTEGAAVTQVLPDSPAQQAGLLPGDIITSISGIPIKNASEVVNTVGFLRVNSRIKIAILRGSKQLSLGVTLADPMKRKMMMAQHDPFLHGISLKNFSLLSPIHGNIQAVLVVSVEDGSNPWNSDLKPGDVITSANQHKIKNIEELRAVAAKSDKSLLLNVLRGPSAFFLVIGKEA